MNAYIIPGLKKTHTKETIFSDVCKIYGVSPDVVLLNNNSREREFVEIRQVSMVAMRVFLKDKNNRERMSYKECSKFFNKDRTTAIYAFKNVLSLWDTDKIFKSKVFELFECKRPE